MAKKENTNPIPDGFYCRLKVDRRTVIMVRTKESLQKWLKTYPKATNVGFSELNEVIV